VIVYRDGATPPRRSQLNLSLMVDDEGEDGRVRSVKNLDARRRRLKRKNGGTQLRREDLL